MSCDQEEDDRDVIAQCNMLLTHIKEEFEDDFIGELEQPPEQHPDELLSAITTFNPPEEQALAVKQEEQCPLASIHPKRKVIMDLRQRYLMEIEIERQNQGQLNEEPVKKRCRVDQTVAGRLLREQGQWSKVIGNVPGIYVGDIFFSRAEMWMVGLHQQTQAGIDVMHSQQVKCNVAVSVVMMVSGNGYKDDQDMADVVLYSGQGGATHRSAKEKHKEDQKAVKGNEGLINSCQQQLPVRFIRGYRGKEASLCPFKVFYSYDGLYMVRKVIYEAGVHGNKVYKFLMERMKNQEPLKLWREPRLAIRGSGCSTAERLLEIEGYEEPACLAVLPPCSTQGSALADEDGSCQEFMGSSCGEFGAEEPSSGTVGFSAVSGEEAVSGATIVDPPRLAALEGFRRHKSMPAKSKWMPFARNGTDQSAIGTASLSKPTLIVENGGNTIMAVMRVEQADQAVPETAVGKHSTLKESEAFSTVPDQTVVPELAAVKCFEKTDQISSTVTPDREASISAENDNEHAGRARIQDERDHSTQASKVRTADEGEHSAVKRFKKTDEAHSVITPVLTSVKHRNSGGQTELPAAQIATKNHGAGSTLNTPAETGPSDVHYASIKTTETTDDLETQTVQKERQHVSAQRGEETGPLTIVETADRTATGSDGTTIGPGTFASNESRESAAAGRDESNKLRQGVRATASAEAPRVEDMVKEKNQTMKRGESCEPQRKKKGGGYVFPSFESLLRK